MKAIVIKTDMEEIRKSCAGCPVVTEETVKQLPYCKAVNKFTECFMWQKPKWCPLIEMEIEE